MPVTNWAAKAVLIQFLGSILIGLSVELHFDVLLTRTYTTQPFAVKTPAVFPVVLSPNLLEVIANPRLAPF
jgi:hypothetical protein